MVDTNLKPNSTVSSLHLHYRGFLTTTDSSAPAFHFGTLTLMLPNSTCVPPFALKSRFPRSTQEPEQKSCRLYAGCRMTSKHVSRHTLPEITSISRFRHHLELSTLVQRFTFVHLFCSHHSLTLTTIPFGYSGSRRFDTCSCKPMPKSQFLHLPYSFSVAHGRS